ncbi:hypothetical protein L195_g005444 [Trifolium pratense]|uniref:Retrotransposon gag domain-containing protein n=1 Tax=Trifolium pratense TaxID=57577 RepID=A0A2K3P0T3_TRIPR|nr:hypothetical protein L195_g005444 [Trifolium pratense]
MRGKAPEELLFDPEIEKTAKANRKATKLAKEAASQAHFEQELSEEEVSSSSFFPEEELIEMEEEHVVPPPPPPRRTLGDYGQRNNGETANLGFQPANPVAFDIKNTVLSALKEDQYSVSESNKRLRLFKHSLTGRAKDWLDTIPPGTINTWGEVEQLFKARFFPLHKFVERRKEIQNFEQSDNKTLHDAWERFKLSLKKCPDHGLDNLAQMQYFTQGLRPQTRMLLDASAGGSLKNKNEMEAKELIETMAHNEYRVQNDRGAKKKGGLLELDTQDAVLAQTKLLSNQMEAFMKRFDPQQQVKEVQELRCDFCQQGHANGGCFPEGSEEAKYLANFRKPYPNGWGSNSNQGQGYNSNPPPPKPSEMEETLTSFMKMTQGNFEAIALENQMCQLSKQVSSLQNQSGFGGNTTDNPKNETCHVISLRSREVPSPVVKESILKKKVSSESEGEVEKNEGDVVVENSKECGEKNDIDGEMEELVENESEGEVEKEKEVEKKSSTKKGKQSLVNASKSKNPSPYAHIPYPRRMKVKGQDMEFRKFIKILNKLEMTMPFVEALEKMLEYKRFMKELLAKKRKSLEEYTVNLNEECSAILQRKLPQKQKDPGSFTIPCSIGNLHIGKALCDLGAGINLMPLFMMKRIPGAVAKPTRMQLSLADRSITYPYGVLQDVLVRCADFVFPADFVILDMKEDAEVPLLLGRQFLATGRALIDVELGELMFRLDDEQVCFKVFEASKFHGKIPECFKVEVLEEVVKDVLEEEWEREIDIFLQQMEECQEEEGSKEFKPSPPILQELPPHWKYVFLGEDYKQPVIISNLLTSLEEEDFMKELKKDYDAVVDGLNGTIPIFYFHMMKKEENLNLVVHSQELVTPSLDDLGEQELMHALEPYMVNSISESLLANVVHVTQEKNEGVEKTKVPKRAPKKKKKKWKNKRKKLNTRPVMVDMLLVDHNVAPLKNEQKRSRVENNLKYPP